MKKKLLALLEKRNARKTELMAKVDATEDLEELKGLNTELEGLKTEIRDLDGMIAAIPDDEGIEGRGAPVPGSKILGTYGMGKTQGKEDRDVEDPMATLEYRRAFMDYVTTGKVSELLVQKRTDATSATTDIGYVIPTNIMNKVVEEMTDYGRILAKISRSNVPAGIQVPYASVKPTASWVAEKSVADKQKKAIAGAITFTYHKLQIRVAVTIEASIVSLPVFEQTITSNINEAIVYALEYAIINGDGDGEPLGILNDTNIPSAHKVSMDVNTLGQYDAWTTALAKVPRKYRNGAVIILNDADFSKYIEGMVDANGQPVARTTFGIDGKQIDRFLGKEVIAVEEYLTSVDDATSGDVFGVIVRLKDYLLNSNMQLTFRKYFDEDTDEWISKATMIADGKLADFNGAVLLKKK